MRGPSISEILDYAGRYYRVEAPATFKNFSSQRKRLDMIVGDFDARTFGLKEVDFLKASLSESLAKGTINNLLIFLGKGFSQAEKYGEIEARPNIPLFKIGDTNARTGFFEPNEVEPLLLYLTRDQAVMHFVKISLFSGMRVNEIREMTWDWVGVDGIYIPAAKTKSRRPRRIPFNSELRAVFDERSALKQVGLGYVVHRKGGKVKNFYCIFKNAIRKIGRSGMVPHDCRRSYARWLIRAGVPEDTVCRILGWSSRKMLVRYNIINDRDMDDAQDRLDRYMADQAEMDQVSSVITKGFKAC